MYQALSSVLSSDTVELLRKRFPNGDEPALILEVISATLVSLKVRVPGSVLPDLLKDASDMIVDLACSACANECPGRRKPYLGDV